MPTNETKPRGARANVMPVAFGMLAMLTVFGLISAMHPETVAVADATLYPTPAPTPTPYVAPTPPPPPTGTTKTKKGR